MTQFKYRQLIDYYQQLIAQDELTQGDKLPSVREMAKQHQVSISTAAKVLSELEKNKLVEARYKSGYFVKEKNNQPAPDYGYKVFAKPDLETLPLAQSVQYSFNDESILPLSCTGPSTVLDHEQLLNKLHRKVLATRPYRLRQDNFEAGIPELRQALADHLSNSHHAVSPDNILITHGRSDALNTALTALDLLNTCVAIEAPCSFFINANLEQLGIESIAVPMQGDYSKEIELLDKAYKQHHFSAYIFNPNFNDPTGRLLTDNNKLALISWAQKRKVILIEYDRGELYFYGSRPSPITHLVEPHHQTPVISLGDFSDTVSFNFSIGYMICHQSAKQCLFTRHITIEKPDIVSQKILAELIIQNDYRKLLTRLRKQMFSQYQMMLKQLAPLNTHIGMPPIVGGPCLWLQLPDKKSSEALFNLLIKHKVSIAPGKMFLSSHQFDGYFRLTFALPWDKRMTQGIDLLVTQTLLFLES